MKKNKFITIIIAIILIVFSFFNSSNGEYRVIRVVDGDTIVVDFEGKDERLRLIGIDTPESVHPDKTRNVREGEIASDYTKSKLEGKSVKLEFDVEERDQYGRLLAYVWINDEMFNRVLLEEGYASVATFPPNVKYVDDFIKLERQAKKAKRGFWGDYEEGQEEVEIEEEVLGKYKGSKNGDKYHLGNYDHPGKIAPKNIIWFNSIEDAERKGYKPCGICFK